MASELFGDDLAKVLPVVRPGGSDSATFDNVLELLDARRALAAARGDDDDPRGLPEPRRRPAAGARRLLRLPRLPDGAVGRPRGGRLHRRARDRRDARPQRAAPRPLDGDHRRLRVLASEAGVLAGPAAKRQAQGRLAPGKLFLVDLEAGRIVAGRRGQARGRRAARPTAPGSTSTPFTSTRSRWPRRRALERAAALLPARLRLLAARTSA